MKYSTMRLPGLFLFIAIASCNLQEDKSVQDTLAVKKTDSSAGVIPDEEVHIHATDTVDVYSNQRFKEVYVQKLSDTSYRITGKAQVFEAAYSWVVEDGHNELKKGHGTTDAGAPAFGNFVFTLNIHKERPNSTLQLILFEASAKDGSRQYELPIPLH